jgi:acid phosphatase (class A)
MKLILPSALLLSVFTLVALAADPHFLELQSVDAVTLLPPPPAPASAEGIADLDDVLKAQAARTEEDVARGKSESKLTPDAFQKILGTNFTRERCPNLYALLEDAGQDSKILSGNAKECFARPRPKIADARVQPVARGDDEPSYPSGHATRAMLWARILCEIAPEKKDALLDRAEEIGWDRVIIGAHYPSDVYAGEVFGQALAQAMLKNDNFKARLASAKSEFDVAFKRQPVAAAH